MTNNQLTDEKIKRRINEIEDRRSASRDFWDGDYEYPENIELMALRELQEHRKAETADREMLKQLARIISGSDTPGEIRSLTVTAQSLVERCKALAERQPVIAYTDAVELAVVRQGGDGVIWGSPRSGGQDVSLYVASEHSDKYLS